MDIFLYIIGVISAFLVGTLYPFKILYQKGYVAGYIQGREDGVSTKLHSTGEYEHD